MVMLFRILVYLVVEGTPQSYGTELEEDVSWCKKIGFCNTLMSIGFCCVETGKI